MSYENNKTIYLCLFHFMFSVRLPCHSLFATFCLTFRPPERKVFYFGGVLYIFLFTEPWLSQTAQRLLYHQVGSEAESKTFNQFRPSVP